MKLLSLCFSILLLAGCTIGRLKYVTPEGEQWSFELAKSRKDMNFSSRFYFSLRGLLGQKYVATSPFSHCAFAL